MYTYNSNNETTRRYQTLNSLIAGNSDSVVLFGCGDDFSIPVKEITESFDLRVPVYNRSFRTLSLSDAPEAYDAVVASLSPSLVLLHLGMSDLHGADEAGMSFERSYMKLIDHIREVTPGCRITVISLNSGAQGEDSANRVLKNIASSTRCGFHDLSKDPLWNPLGTMKTIAFVCGTGFARSLHRREIPADVVIRILYGFENTCQEQPREEEAAVRRTIAPVAASAGGACAIV